MSHTARHDLALGALKPQRIALLLLAAIAILTALNVVAVIAVRSEGVSAGAREIASRCLLDSELNLPTWFQSTLLFCCAGVLALIALTRRLVQHDYAWHWWALSLIFVLLSLDESASLHEVLIVPFRRRLHATGVFYFAWVVPGLALTAGTAIAYLRFLWQLNRRTRALFLAAGALYVGGALGMEMVGGLLAEQSNFHGTLAEQSHVSVSYLVAGAAEEILEMLGAALFLYALLDYLAIQGQVLAFSVQRSTALADRPAPELMSRSAFPSPHA